MFVVRVFIYKNRTCKHSKQLTTINQFLLAFQLAPTLQSIQPPKNSNQLQKMYKDHSNEIIYTTDPNDYTKVKCQLPFLRLKI